jgi:hypothetical protein
VELAELEEERQRAELDQPARVFELERVDPTQIATCLDRAMRSPGYRRVTSRSRHNADLRKEWLHNNAR